MEESSDRSLRAQNAPNPKAVFLQPDSQPVTRQQIGDFLKSMRARGCVEGSVRKYGHDLKEFYDFLPAEKEITRTTLAEWQAALLARGYAPRTVNAAISEVNGFLAWLGRREYQLSRQLEITDDIQPELTRTEYLRLLSTARALGKERVYLLVKVFAATGLTVQELPQLTVEAVQVSRLTVTANGLRQVIPIPASLRDELTRYIHQTGLTSGPVFVTKNGKRLNRSTVTSAIQNLAHDARVPPEKCNPRCLRKLYQSTIAEIEASVHLLVEQTHERLLEQEQLAIGWEGAGDP